MNLLERPERDPAISPWFVCNTWEEATANGTRHFDAVVIGGGMFGGYCADSGLHGRRGWHLHLTISSAGSAGRHAHGTNDKAELAVAAIVYGIRMGA